MWEESRTALKGPSVSDLAAPSGQKVYAGVAFLFNFRDDPAELPPAGQTSIVDNHLYDGGSCGVFPAGKGSWSGYGTRPRGRGIVDQCCRPGGCSLHVLEMYCAKPKGPKEQQTMAEPTVTSATPKVTVRPLVAECGYWPSFIYFLFFK